jgi:hypothetical protein
LEKWDKKSIEEEGEFDQRTLFACMDTMKLLCTNNL